MRHYKIQNAIAKKAVLIVVYVGDTAVIAGDRRSLVEMTAKIGRQAHDSA